MKTLWDRLFGKGKRSRYLIQHPHLSDYSIDIGLHTDVGRVRASNQDRIGCVRYAAPGNAVVILADGMGGHNGGETASQLAVNILEKRFSRELDQHSCEQALLDSFAEANATIFDVSKEQLDLTGMGTTLVALVIVDGCAYYANVGDSRLYLIRNESCLQLSEDHTMVAQMIKDGLLQPDEAETHPDKNIITRAVGTKPSVEVALSKSPLFLEQSDCFVLCSDGLYDLVSEPELIGIIGQNSAQIACDILVELAKQRGGFDNISVIIVKIEQMAEGHLRVPITRF